MLLGFPSGRLELRAGGDRSRVLTGRFPYNSPAVLSDGGREGRPRKELFEPGAFGYRVGLETEDIHLLVGHDYGQPLASRGAGTLTLRDTAAALTFTATISEEMQQVSWVRDFLIGLAAGLIIGISPGFRIPPKRAVPDAEEEEEEDPDLGIALIRRIKQALLYELSVVTRPAYPSTSIEERRALSMSAPSPRAGALGRWRL